MRSSSSSSRRAASRRRGGLLIEVMVTLALILIFLALGAGLIRLLLRLDRASRDGLDAAATLTRLARDLRHDAHRARPDATPNPEGTRLRLDLPGREVVTYVIDPREVRRERHEGDRLLGRDQYRLAPRASARFEPATSTSTSKTDGRPLVELVIRPGTTTAAQLALTPPARIVAELGRWVAPEPARTP